MILRISEAGSGSLHQEFTFPKNQKPAEVLEKALFYSELSRKFFVDYNKLESTTEKVQVKSVEKNLSIYKIVQLKLMFHCHVKRRKKMKELKRMLARDLSKVIFEELYVEVEDAKGSKLEKAEVFVVVNFPNNSIVFESDGAEEPLNIPIDEFADVFGKGFSYVDDLVLRQLLIDRMPTFLKIKERQFVLDKSIREQRSKLTEDEARKLFEYNDFFMRRGSRPNTPPVESDDPLIIVSERISVADFEAPNEEEQTLLGVEESKLPLESSSRMDATKHSMNLSEVDGREKNMKLFSKEYLKISGKIRKLTVYLDYDTDSFLFKT